MPHMLTDILVRLVQLYFSKDPQFVLMKDSAWMAIAGDLLATLTTQ
jgi:hypothetical protein